MRRSSQQKIILKFINLDICFFLVQASNLQIGKETAFLLARTGKVYYAGRAKRYGLQVKSIAV